MNRVTVSKDKLGPIGTLLFVGKYSVKYNICYINIQDRFALI